MINSRKLQKSIILPLLSCSGFLAQYLVQSAYLISILLHEEMVENQQTVTNRKELDLNVEL